MKKVLMLILLIPSILFSQDFINIQNKKLNDLNDSELQSYWKDAQEKGYDLNQIKILARAQGVSELEINEFEKRIKSLNISNDNEKEELFNRSSLTSIFGKNTKQDNNDEQSLKINGSPIFGSNFFNNVNISPAPQLNIATPASYELGPGDEVLISIWGASENEYTSKISREGFVKVERVGPVYISGLTISEAKNKLKRSLSKIYSGLNFSNNSEFKVFLDLSLISSRSIVVNVTGNVIAPDTYTISSFASILNVLYAAGGPNESGSYRNIIIIRNGEFFKKIDLYEYFSSGKLESFSLRDQDIILVKNFKNRVYVNGEFKNTGIFEFNDNETIDDLISYTGGISSFGYKEMLFIKRTDGINRKIDNVIKNNFSTYKLKDGDIIEARTVTDTYTNLVTIEGAVSVPGEYSIINNQTTLNNLINKAGGLKEDAINERGFLIRKFNGIENEVIPFKISNDIDKIKLKANDKIIISSNNDISRLKNVTIQGEVDQPGSYPFYDGMTLTDLLLISKGVSLKANLNDIQIYRSTYDETNQNPIKSINLSIDNISNFSNENNFKLEENDLVVIRQKKGFDEKEYVTVNGLVKKPGIYAIKNNEYSFYDLMKDFDGFQDDASINGVKILRKNKLFIEDDLQNIDQLNVKYEIKPFIEFGVNVKKIIETNGQALKYNVFLKPGDKIEVPKIDNTIEITGAVQQSSVITYSKSTTTISAINQAGGFKETAKKNGVYVVYQNGNILSTKSFFIFNNYPKLQAGAKIIVPEKNITREKTSVGELVGYTTSLVSIIALIKSL